MPYKIPLTAWLFLSLITFTIINPITSWDIAALVLIIFIILYHLLDDFALVALLVARPTIDIWRDSAIFSTNWLTVNFNGAISLILLFWSIFFFSKEKEYWKNIPLKWPWFAFLAWCTLSLFWSYDLSGTITETLKAANLAALFGAMYILRLKHNTKFTENTILALLGAAVIPLILAAYQFTTHTGMMIDGVANRIYGTFAHPNILATFALLILMTLTYAKLKKEKLPIFFAKTKTMWITIGISLITIALTYTRIAWIGTALFIIIIGYIYFRQLLLYFLGTVILAYALFFPINQWLIYDFNYSLQSNALIARLTMRNEDADSIKWRADVTNKVLPLWQKQPLVGYGYGAFAKVWDDNKGVANIWDNTSEAHNDYLKVGFEAGIVGLLFFLSLFFGLFQIAWKKKNWVFMASIAVYLTLSLSDNMLHHTPVIWWLWAMWGMWCAENE